MESSLEPSCEELEPLLEELESLLDEMEEQLSEGGRFIEKYIGLSKES